MEFLAIIICIPQAKYIIFLAFLNFILTVAAHIKNNTYDYRNLLKFLTDLSGYLIIIIVFSTLACAGGLQSSEGVSLFNYVIDFSSVLNTVCGLILLVYARKILNALMLMGLDVAKFLPFLRSSQGELIDNTIHSMEKTKNLW